MRGRWPARHGGLALALTAVIATAAQEGAMGAPTPTPIPVFVDRADRGITPPTVGLAAFLAANAHRIVRLDVFVPSTPQQRHADAAATLLPLPSSPSGQGPAALVVNATPEDAARFAIVIPVADGALLRGFYRIADTGGTDTWELVFVPENNVMLDPTLDYRFQTD